ncbi:MAG: hypothetical protein CBC09_02850 [Cellvibrionales bacterium TMED49]|nr:hypothetical protein [Porticoccaceae bacterium]OUU39330.1 MAG: hypothetical protein CBC09_02850 [Cellvibrionales bacterium TMED49]
MLYSPLTRKITAFLVSTCLIFGLTNLSFLSHFSHQHATETLTSKGNLLLKNFEERISTAMDHGDNISIQVSLNQITEDPLVYSASLYNRINDMRVRSQRGGHIPSQLQVLRLPVKSKKNPSGFVELSLDQERALLPYRWIIITCLSLWTIFTATIAIICLKFTRKISSRLTLLSNQLPNKKAFYGDELRILEQQLETLITPSDELDGLGRQARYCSLVRVTLFNRRCVGSQLNKENQELLFEKLDLCISRTIELYGARRLEGEEGVLYFEIQSAEFSKKHLLACMMCMYAMRQLLYNLASKMGIELRVGFTACGNTIATAPTFHYQEQVYDLKKLSTRLSKKLESGAISIFTDGFSCDQLSTIAVLSQSDDNFFIFKAFPPNRQDLMEKQIQYLEDVCLSHTAVTHSS